MMFVKFIVERGSWIAFFCCLQLIILVTAYLDQKIPLQPIWYIVFITSLLFILFLITRYQKESAFYRSLSESPLEVTKRLPPSSPFEQIVHQSLEDYLRDVRSSLSANMISLENEKDELLAWIHEVKTPLTAMHLILNRVDDPKLKSQLMNEWLKIHLLLDLQLHQKRMLVIENDLFVESVNLEDILYDEIKMLQTWCLHKGIGFDIQLEGTNVYCDAKWIAFTIRQLLSNAVKYSQESDILIRSYLQQDQWRLEIQDCGCGIDNKDMPRIFEKGFTSTRNHQSTAATGMGLYLAKRACDAMNITIQVDSKLHVGTTMTLIFPDQNHYGKRLGM